MCYWGVKPEFLRVQYMLINDFNITGTRIFFLARVCGRTPLVEGRCGIGVDMFAQR